MKKLPDLGPPDENPGDIGFDDPEVEAAYLDAIGKILREAKAQMELQPKPTSRQAGSQGAKPRKSSGSK
ncbi:MAG: hypothetical protein UZ07_CHB004001103 [Chlorobi bacterium OLB7]|nr:MAG: hypothetical protein UZ07_CHB004001103 [Chlorobi bacterium OLB7]